MNHKISSEWPAKGLEKCQARACIIASCHGTKRGWRGLAEIAHLCSYLSLPIKLSRGKGFLKLTRGMVYLKCFFQNQSIRSIKRPPSSHNILQPQKAALPRCLRPWVLGTAKLLLSRPHVLDCIAAIHQLVGRVSKMFVENDMGLLAIFAPRRPSFDPSGQPGTARLACAPAGFRGKFMRRRGGNKLAPWRALRCRLVFRSLGSLCSAGWLR